MRTFKILELRIEACPDCNLSNPAPTTFTIWRPGQECLNSQNASNLAKFLLFQYQLLKKGKLVA